MHSRQINSLGSLQSDQQQSNNTFQSDSDPRPSAAPRSLFSFQSTQCPLCINNYIILQQLSTLKNAVLAKNHKIAELQNFIEKLSKMAFTESTDNQTYLDALEDKQKSKTSLSSQSEDMTFAPFPSDRQFSRSKNGESRSRASLALQPSSSSSIISEMTITEKQLIKKQIKTELKKMNLSGTEQKSSPTFQKQSLLRNKLMQIINVLPANDSSPNLQSFRTESEPFQEGKVHSIQENPQQGKHRDPPTQGESSNNSSLKNTIKSQTSPKNNQLTFALA